MKYTHEQLREMAWAVLTDQTGKGAKVVAEVARRTGMDPVAVTDRLIRMVTG